MLFSTLFAKAKGEKKRPANTPHSVHAYHVGGREMPLTVMRKARVKRLTLRIENGAKGLRVTAPLKVKENEILNFVARQHEWLEAKLALMPVYARVRADIKLPLLGVPHRIVHDSARRGTVKVMELNGEAVLQVNGDDAHLARRVADFLKREAKAYMLPLVSKHAGTVGRLPKAIRFRDTSSRWGSCTSEGGLMFSWRIMMAPPTVIDYLVAHECAHLIHMNHGPDFWALCHELAPRTDEAKEWLKRNGSTLQAFEF